MGLERLAGYAFGHFAGEPLRHAGLLIAPPPAVNFFGDEVGELAGGLDLGSHGRDLEADRLELGDGPAKLDTLLGIRNRVLHRATGEADGAGGGMRARPLEPGNGAVEAAAPASATQVERLAAIEVQLPGLPAVVANLVHGCACAVRRQRAALLFDEEGGRAAVPVLDVRDWFGAGQDGDVIRAVGERAPHLGSREQVVVRATIRVSFGAAL